MKRDNAMTQRFLVDAGVMTGMRALELGCGGGEVTQLLAELVGPSGFVLGIDRDDMMLSIAQKRMHELGLQNVQFIADDATGTLPNLDAFDVESFDVLAGRRVLMYLPNPTDVIRRFTRWLRSDGVVVFEESDSTLMPGRRVAMPKHDKAVIWLRQMLEAEGANSHMGFDLPATLVQAGLKFERVKAEAVIQGQGSQYPLAYLLKMMQSRLISNGIATQTEVDYLIEQTDIESRDQTAVYISDMSFCAWARKF